MRVPNQCNVSVAAPRRMMAWTCRGPMEVRMARASALRGPGGPGQTAPQLAARASWSGPGTSSTGWEGRSAPSLTWVRNFVYIPTENDNATVLKYQNRIRHRK